MNVNALHSLTETALTELDSGEVDVQRVNARLRIATTDLSIHRMALAVAKLTGEQLGIVAFIGDGKTATKKQR